MMMNEAATSSYASMPVPDLLYVHRAVGDIDFIRAISSGLIGPGEG